MAKSKSGGTRSYIRGRVGSDVYSIGKDAKGKKQQVVRSLAESVANPQTRAQMRGRMIMSTIAQVLAELRPICDHSFDNVVGARANLAEFTSRNYALVKADVAAHPDGSNEFGLVKYGERVAKRGAYVISDGQASIPAALVLAATQGKVTITLLADNVTVQGLKNVLGMNSEEYFTMVGLTTAGKAVYERFRVNPNMAGSTALTSENIADAFLTEGNGAAAVAIASNVITITLSPIAGCAAVIVSKKYNGAYIHNEAILAVQSGIDFNADAALPTYPVGSMSYLNGGDVLGMSESSSDIEEEEQGGGGGGGGGSTAHTLTIRRNGDGDSSVKIGGVEQTGTPSVEAGTEIAIKITPAAESVPTATFDGSNVELTKNGAYYTGTVTMPDHDATLTCNSGDGGGQN